MKTLNLIFAMILSVHTFANEGKYVEQMAKHIQAVYNASTPEQYQSAINAFERIAAAEKTKWEPYYYSAFGYLMLAHKEKDGSKKDVLLDKAMEALENGKKINDKESELIALQGFVHMIRVTVDPAARGAQYSGLAYQLYGKAIAMNPENPRALAFLAQMQMGTAQFMGQPTTEACATAKKSLEKFDTYKTENPLAPQWGKGMTENLAKQCQ